MAGVVVVGVVTELVVHHLVAQLEEIFPLLDFVGSFQQMKHVLVMLNDAGVDGADLHHVVATVAAMVLVVSSQLGDGDGDAHEMLQH